MIKENFKNNWKSCEINDVADRIHYGFTATAKPDGSGAKYLRITDIQNGHVDWASVPICDITPEEFEKFRLFENDLVFARTGGTVGKSFLLNKQTPENAVFASYLIRVIINENIYPKYIYYFFQSLNYWSQIELNKTGLKTNVNAQILSRLKFNLAPLPEQRAIVAKIEQLFSELDNGIANLKAAKDKLEIYRQAVLKKAFEGELTKEWREQQTDLPTADELLEQIKEERLKHYENQLTEWEEAVAKWEADGKQGNKPSKPKKINEPDPLEKNDLSDLDPLPYDWGWVRLANMVVDSSNDIVDGPFGSNLKSSEYVDSGYPILRIQNIKANTFINKNIKYITEEKYHSLQRHQFLPSDIIITKLGDPLGLACRVPKDFNEGVIVADLIRLRPSSQNINYDWLTMLINSHLVQGQFRAITKGTTRPRMNLTIMRNVYLPLCSFEEQNQIVQEIESRLSVCDNILANIEEGLEKSEALRQSILKQAFDGKLLSEEELEACRKEQDWEPAEKLLERIKNEKLAKA